MIPALGTMIGAYIITRMVDLVFDAAKSDGVRSYVVSLLAIGTIFVAGLMTLSMLASGVDASASLP